MAIIGGAILPYLAGRVTDAAGQLPPAFYIPLLGYAGIAVFAFCAARTPAHTAAVPVAHA